MSKVRQEVLQPMVSEVGEELEVLQEEGEELEVLLEEGGEL